MSLKAKELRKKIEDKQKDEPLIHISIEKLIQACSKEDEVLHAYNGHEMLKMLEEHEIAMAYVDIKMPGPSGLEAIKLGKEISPDTRYYIMTGFNEFEYAKQAVKLKVEDYTSDSGTFRSG